MSEPKRRLRAAALHVPLLGALLREHYRLRAEVLDQRERRMELNAEIERLKDLLRTFRAWRPPGHFYSPVPSREDIEARAADIFDRSKRDLPGIDLREAEQLALLEQLKRFYSELPFTTEGSPDLRYRFSNKYYGQSDAIFLYSIIRHLEPKRIIEVGSGYSSGVILDTNQLFFEGSIECTFIEPFPHVLRSVLRPGDADHTEIITLPVQDVDPERFEALEAGDILLIDSTHVAKTGSDVNRLFFDTLPRLRPGVWVHVHDIFWPFEYPEGWVRQGRAWNEVYLLRAFLMFSSAYEVALFTTHLMSFHEDWFRREMPLCLENPGGSIWLRRR